MIVRLWSGWTEPDNTEAYERLLTSTIAPRIVERQLPGLHSLEVLRRDSSELAPEVGGEFLTVMTFADLESVRAFTGGQAGTSVVPAAARALLARHDEHSRHYLSVARYEA